jgi:hypothetical protein
MVTGVVLPESYPQAAANTAGPGMKGTISLETKEKSRRPWNSA